MKWGSLLFAVAAIAAGTWYYQQSASTSATRQAKSPLPGGALVLVALPTDLTEQEVMGKRGFDAVCATCHGANAQGHDGVAPPLVHQIYETGHHGDMAFVLAAKNGVVGHHWPFGNMPPVEGVTHADMLNIVAYIRALQRENGIN